MPVDSDDAGPVFELDDVAVPTLPAEETHTPFARGPNRSSHWRGVVNASVRANAVQDGMPARWIEARADARKLHGRADECLTQALPVGPEILTASLCVDVTNGSIFTTVIDELRRQNTA